MAHGDGWNTDKTDNDSKRMRAGILVPLTAVQYKWTGRFVLGSVGPKLAEKGNRLFCLDTAFFSLVKVVEGMGFTPRFAPLTPRRLRLTQTNWQTTSTMQMRWW